MSKRVLILGIGGQDGSYLAEILLAQGCEVHGLVRRSSADNLFRIRHLLDRITLHQGDLTDRGSLAQVVVRSCSTVIYNMADQDHVGFSLAAPRVSVDVTYGGVANLLDIVKGIRGMRVFQPLSITMFGAMPPPQNEATYLAPQSPYAVAKAAAWLACKHYRREYGLDVRCAIFANHDSPRRQGDYLLHKICRRAVEIARGGEGTLALYNPEEPLDVGFAGDYMRDAVSIMSLPEPDDFVIGGDYAWGTYQVGCHIAPSFRTVTEWAFASAGIDLGKEWKPDSAPARTLWDRLIKAEEKPFRLGPQPTFVADCSKARSRFALHPRKSLRELIGEIVEKYRRERP